MNNRTKRGDGGRRRRYQQQHKQHNDQQQPRRNSIITTILSDKEPNNKLNDELDNDNSNTNNTNIIMLAADTRLTTKMKKKTYIIRRKKVVRTWVFLIICIVPILIILLEYYIGKVIDLDDVKDVYEVHVYDPWELLLMDLIDDDQQEGFNDNSNGNDNKMFSLPNISHTPRTVETTTGNQKSCPRGQRRMINVHNPMSHMISIETRRIPMIVHQQSQTRCLTMDVDRATIKWAFRRWSYYIHDETSKNRLFDRYCGASPHKLCKDFPLLYTIVAKCLTGDSDNNNRRNGYTSFLRAELWKFLNLWIFGGLYVDLGLMPLKFSPETINNDDDGLFVIDYDTGMLNPSIMAVSPYHPIMYYAIQHLILYAMTTNPMGYSSSSSLVSTSNFNNNDDTNRIGSFALNQAFYSFQKIEQQTQHSFVVNHGKSQYDRVEEHIASLSPGIFNGPLNRSVRLVADGRHSNSNEKNNDYAIPLAVSIFTNRTEKEIEFRKMGIILPESIVTATTTANNSYATLSNNRNIQQQSFFCLKKLYKYHHH